MANSSVRDHVMQSIKQAIFNGENVVSAQKKQAILSAYPVVSDEVSQCSIDQIKEIKQIVDAIESLIPVVSLINQKITVHALPFRHICNFELAALMGEAEKEIFLFNLKINKGAN